MAISSRLAELNRKYGTAGGGQAEKQSAARKAGTVSARLAALQQRTAQNGSVSAKSQSADAQYLRGRICAAHDGPKKGGAGGRRGAEERRPAPDRRGETGGEKSICSGDRQKRGVFRAEPVQQRAGKYP